MNTCQVCQDHESIDGFICQSCLDFELACQNDQDRRNIADAKKAKERGNTMIRQTAVNVTINIQLHNCDNRDGINLHANALPGVGRDVYDLTLTEGLYLGVASLMLTAEQIHRLAAQLADISQDIMRTDEERKENAEG